MTGRKLQDCVAEVDLSVQRLFHWGAYCDKYGGGVQVGVVNKETVPLGGRTVINTAAGYRWV